MLCMLLEYIFELCGQYSRLCCEHWFINKQTLAHKKPVWLEKTRLTSLEIQAVCIHDSYRCTFMLSLVHSNINLLVHKQASYYNIVHLISIYKAGKMNSL